MQWRELSNTSWLQGDVETELHGSVWHATGEDQFKRIISEGQLVPDAPARYENGFARKIEAISLFDFRSPYPYATLAHWSEWVPDDPTQSSYWMQINLERVGDSFISPGGLLDRWKKEEAYSYRIIPHVEAAHMGALRVERLLRTVEIRRPADFRKLIA